MVEEAFVLQTALNKMKNKENFDKEKWLLLYQKKNKFKLFRAIHEFTIFFEKLTNFSDKLYDVSLKETVS